LYFTVRTYPTTGGAFVSLVAMNPDGSRRFARPLPATFGAYNNAPVIGADGSVYVTSQTGGMMSFSPSGHSNWSLTRNGLTTPAIDSAGHLYVLDSPYSPKLLQISSTGNVNWELPISAAGYGYFSSPVIAADGTIEFVINNKLYAVNPAGSGSVAWTSDIAATAGCCDVMTPTIGADGTTYVTNQAGRLSAINPTTHTLDWTPFDGITSNSTTSTIVSSGRLYIAGRNGSGQAQIHAINTTSLGLANSPWAKVGHDLANTSSIAAPAAAHRFLRFTGRVVTADAQSTPVGGYDLTVKNSVGDILCDTVTDATGNYVCGTPSVEFGAIPVTYTVSGTLGTQTLGGVIADAGAADSVTETVHDLAFVPSRRTITFTGNLTNQTYAGLPVGYVNINVKRVSTGETLCSTYAYYSYYSCSKLIDELGAFDVSVTATGNIGTATASTTVPAGLGGVDIIVSRDVSIAGTVLHISGLVKDQNAVGISGATVINNYGQASTTSSGSYEQYISISANTPSISLDWTVSDGLNRQIKQQSVNLNSGVMNDLNNQDFVLDNSAIGAGLWKLKVPNSNGVSPLALGSNGLIYLTSGGKLYAYDQNGQQQWVALPSNLGQAISVGSNGNIYVTASDSLYAFSSDGVQIWQFTTTGATQAIAIETDGSILVTTYFGIRRIAANGSELWSHPFTSTESAPIVAKDGMIYLSANQKFYALNSDGSESWSKPITSRYPAAIDGDGNIIVAGNKIYAFKPNGDSLWTYEIPTPFGQYVYDNTATSGVSIASDGTILVLASQGYDYASHPFLLALDVGGSLKWKYKFVNDASFSEIPIIGSDGLIYVTGNEYNSGFGVAYGLNLQGTVIWKYQIPQNNIYLNEYGSILGSGGKLFVSSKYLGDVYALNITSSGLANSPWPKFQHDNQNTGLDTSSVQPTRILRFTGTTTNTNQSGSNLAGFQVSISKDTGALLCNTTVKVDGSYTCSIRNTDLTSFSIRYDLSSSNGDGSSTGVVVAGNAGTTTEVAQNLSVGLTTLHLTGHVKNTSGSSVVGNVNISGDISATFATDASGNYDTYLTFLNLQSSVTLTMTATSPSGYQVSSNSLVIPLISKGLTNQVTNLEIPVSELHLFGVVKNAGGAIMPGLIVNIGGVSLATDTSGKFDTILEIPNTTVQLELTVSTTDGLNSASSTFTVNITPTIVNQKAVDLVLSNQGRWKFPSNIYGSPTPALASDGTIYVGSGYGLLALNPDGTQKWVTSQLRSYPNSPTIASNGTVYISAYDSLYAVNSTDGSNTLVYQSMNSAVLSDLAIGADGTIYFSTGTQLVAINPSNNSQKWVAPATTGIHLQTPIVLSDGTVVTPSYGELYAWKPTDGSAKWNVPLTTTGSLTNLAVGASGIIYTGSSNGHLYGVKPDGTLPFTDKVISTFSVSAPSIGTNGVVYVVSNNLLHAVKTDGTELWTPVTAGDSSSAPTVGADGSIYITSTDGKLYVIGSIGQLIWSFTTTYGLSSSVAIANDGTVYLPGSYYGLYALNSSSFGLLNSPWPKAFGNAQNTGRAP
jgi:outer membrane protein assembly factor BamB